MPSDEQIRQVLLRTWDPLSIGDNPNLADEYDAFIPRLRECLRDATVESVSDLLQSFEAELGDFDFDGKERTAAANELIAR